MDNHIADQGQREYEKRGECPCGHGNIEEIEWCTNDNCECFNDRCPSYSDMFTCVMMEAKNKCLSCGSVSET